MTELEARAAFNDAKAKLNRLAALYLQGEPVAPEVDEALKGLAAALAALADARAIHD